jgi:hypothetical protein
MRSNYHNVSRLNVATHDDVGTMGTNIPVQHMFHTSLLLFLLLLLLLIPPLATAAAGDLMNDDCNAARDMVQYRGLYFLSFPIYTRQIKKEKW